VNEAAVKIVPVILAGGVGTRLWPASREESPKQYLALLGGDSLINATYERILPLAGDGQVYVVTVAGHEDLVAAQLPGLPPENIWCEPAGRNTGPSIAWALHELQQRHAGDVAVFFPADHLVRDGEALRQAVTSVATAAGETGQVGLLGVRPERPETGYGYVEAAAAAAGNFRTVTRFLEKPDRATATQLMARDDMFWNSGIFALPVAGGLRLVRTADQGLADFLDELPAPGTGRGQGDAGRGQVISAFNGVMPTPFDIAVMEKAPHGLLVPLSAGWSDLGNWQAVWEQGDADENGNVVGPGGRVEESSGCLVISDGRKIAVLGARDLIVVAWGDSVLVCPRDRAQDVRMLAGSSK
jgi:mannose-1-phosphate guanylyltransferase/mannose-6-phosphate isomerase